jgi:hypothetical protein
VINLTAIHDEGDRSARHISSNSRRRDVATIQFRPCQPSVLQYDEPCRLFRIFPLADRRASAKEAAVRSLCVRAVAHTVHRFRTA